MKPKISKRWPERSVETFFDIWNPDMAYVLGYFAADGSMYQNKRGSCYIAFTSTDRDLIAQVKNIMKVSNRIEVYQAKEKPNQKLRYTLQIGSKSIFGKLLKLGFTPNKSLTLKFPPVSDDLIGHFLRGYFDGDGCASFVYYKRKNRKNLQRILNMRIRCGSKEFIQILQNKLAEIKHTKGLLYFHSGAYELVYRAKDVIKLYSFAYPTLVVPCLKRKRDILIKGLKAFNVGP